MDNTENEINEQLNIYPVTQFNHSLTHSRFNHSLTHSRFNHSLILLIKSVSK